MLEDFADCDADGFGRARAALRNVNVSAPGTFETSCDVGSSVAIRGRTDIARTSRFGSECRAPAGIIVPTFPQRSPPWLLTKAASGGLGSAANT